MCRARCAWIGQLPDPVDRLTKQARPPVACILPNVKLLKMPQVRTLPRHAQERTGRLGCQRCARYLPRARVCLQDLAHNWQ
jgi:hypothetical protein